MWAARRRRGLDELGIVIAFWTLAALTLGAAAMPDYRGDLPSLDLPIRLLAGASDDKFRRIARAMARSLPQGSLEIVPGAGHNLILEASRAVAAAILEAVAPPPHTPARPKGTIR